MIQTLLLTWTLTTAPAHQTVELSIPIQDLRDPQMQTTSTHLRQ